MTLSPPDCSCSSGGEPFAECYYTRRRRVLQLTNPTTPCDEVDADRRRCSQAIGCISPIITLPTVAYAAQNGWIGDE